MRIILLCNSHLSAFDQKVLNHINKYAELRIVGIVINTKPKPGILQRLKRELRKGRGGYVVVQSARAVLSKFKKNDSIHAVDYSNRLSIPYFETQTLYTPGVFQWISKLNPEILFLRGFGVIKDPILNIAPYGVLSYHHADITKYRGGPPLFWELFYNEKEAGITLQILDEGLDTGTIVLQKFVPIKNDTWSSLKRKAYLESEPMAAEALLMLKKMNPFRNPIGTRGKLLTLPNLRQWLGLQAKIAFRSVLR
ncbi:MAG: hypothetical protein KF763_02495 [Cyclobacteriaceae bacterium]|nr:hypothetical protein [Cyclobacteriaceae bacterium]